MYRSVDAALGHRVSTPGRCAQRFLGWERPDSCKIPTLHIVRCCEDEMVWLKVMVDSHILPLNQRSVFVTAPKEVLNREPYQHFMVSGCG